MEEEIWCDNKCYTNDDHNANYYEDGNTKVYKDNDGNEYICSKHHWACAKCDKIVQVG